MLFPLLCAHKRCLFQLLCAVMAAVLHGRVISATSQQCGTVKRVRKATVNFVPRNNSVRFWSQWPTRNSYLPSTIYKSLCKSSPGTAQQQKCICSVTALIYFTWCIELPIQEPCDFSVLKFALEHRPKVLIPQQPRASQATPELLWAFQAEFVEVVVRF